MKRKLLLIAVLLTAMLFPITDVIASHGLGGEITWTCLPNGQFKFRMKFYRDCNGIQAPTNITLTTTVPGMTSIPMPKVQQNDITPTGIPAPGVGTCPTCAAPGGAMGVVEEHIYESAPVTLNGVPPATGWQFYWGTCCRSGALSNILSPGSTGFRNRAIMFPYNGQNTNPCFDSSPYFAEKPSTIICTGYPFKYNPNAIDVEMDSLVSAWGQPLDDAGLNVAFSGGYNISSQLPSPTQNPSNVAAVINSVTGEMTYTSYTGGYFVTVVKVTAYKCGIKVAEIYREINVVLNNGCPSIINVGLPAQNLPPDVPPPFPHPITGVANQSYDITVYAGDTVNFMFSALDFDQFLNGTFQTITIEASGSQFGTNFSNTNSGCLIPPCATLVPAAPTPQNPLQVGSFQIGGSTTFNWVTTCEHVEGLDTNCRRFINTYTFVIKATDNYCPANASNIGTIRITVKEAPKLDPPEIRCASVDDNGGVTLNWQPPTPADTQGTFHSYQIYASANGPGGPWQVVDSVLTPYDSPLSYTYYQSAGNLQSMFGTDAQQQSISYYIATRSGCRGDSISDPSNVLNTMYVQCSVNASNLAEITWNPLSSPPLPTHHPYYMIHRADTSTGVWVLIDSTQSTTYIDSSSAGYCSVGFRYKVSLSDSSGCISWSSNCIAYIASSTVQVQFIPPNDTIICQGSSVSLQCTNTGVTSYAWSTGAITPSINVSTSGVYTLAIVVGNCASMDSIEVTVVPNPTPTITGIDTICQGQSTSFNAGNGFTSYDWGPQGNTQSISTGTAGLYTVTVVDTNGCSGTDNILLVVNPLPSPSISGDLDFCLGQSTTLSANAGYSNYNWGGGNTGQSLGVSAGGSYTVTVTDNNGCSNSVSATVTVNALPTPSITGDLDFCQGDNTTLDAGSYNGYVWSTGGGATGQTINVNTANTFTVTVTDVNGCTGSASATTIVFPNPTPVITGNDTICNGTTTTLNAGAGYSNYVWGGNGSGSGQSITTGIPGNYIVTVTDANNCEGTTNMSVTVLQLPAVTLAGTATICNGDTTDLNLTFSGPGPYTYSYSNGSATYGPFTTPSTNVNIPVYPSTGTTYNLVSVLNANCTGTVSGVATITVNPLPSAAITGTNTICLNDSSVIQIDFPTGNGPFTYSYSNGSQTFGPFTTANNPEFITVNPTATTTYGLTPTVTTANGCVGNTNAATAIVTVNALPSVVLTGDTTLCDGASSPLVLNFTGQAPFTYSYWNGTANVGPVITSNNPTTITVTPPVGTTNYSMVSLVDDNACVGSVSGAAAIIVNALPTATLSGTAKICTGGNADLTFNFTGAGPFTYYYSDGTTTYGPFTTAQATELVNVTPSDTTNYTLVTIEDSNCSGSVSGNALITVIPPSSATLTGTTEICKGDTTQLTINFTGAPPFEYSYTDGSLVTGPLNTLSFSNTINVHPDSTTTYNLTFLSGEGCAGIYSGTVEVKVNMIPDAVATLSGDDELCFGESSEITIDFTGVAPFTYTYTDGFGVFGPITTSNNPEVIPVTPGSNVNYTLVNMSDLKCTGTYSGNAAIIVHPIPEATFTGTPSICEGDSATVSIIFTGTAPYTYAYSDGSGTYGAFVTNNNPEVLTFGPSLTTSYTVTAMNDSNCVGTTAGTATITVNVIPTAVISGSTMICRNETTDLNFTFTGVAPFTFTYTDGTTSYGPVVSNTNTYAIPVSPDSTTNYALTFLEDLNCEGTLSGTVEVFVNQLPEPVITGDLEICDGESSTLTATTGYPGYLWSNGATADSIAVTTNGTYTVTVTDMNGCKGSYQVDFTVNQTPVINFSAAPSLTCDTPATVFTNTSTYPTGSQFIWDFGDSIGSAQASPTHIYGEEGFFLVTLTINTNAGCTATDTQTVEVTILPLAEAKFKAEPEIINVFSGPVQFTDESEHAVSWYWDFDDGTYSAQQNPLHYFNDVGNYNVILTVTNIAGCPDVAVREIMVNPFYVPNAFTPNADGINDYFFDAGYVLDVKSYRLRIFNRWGQMVYETNDYTKFWNGFGTDSKPAQDGVYVYTIEVVTKRDKEHNFKGTVTLLR